MYDKWIDYVVLHLASSLQVVLGTTPTVQYFLVRRRGYPTADRRYRKAANHGIGRKKTKKARMGRDWVSLWWQKEEKERNHRKEGTEEATKRSETNIKETTAGRLGGRWSGRDLQRGRIHRKGRRWHQDLQGSCVEQIQRRANERLSLWLPVLFHMRPGVILGALMW